MMKHTKIISALAAAIFLSACATNNNPCQTQQEIDRKYKKRFGTAELGKKYHKLYADFSAKKDLDIDVIQALAQSPKGTNYSKTNYYSLLSSVYYSKKQAENGEAAHNKAMSYDGFRNDAERLAVTGMHKHFEENRRTFSGFTKEERKDNHRAIPAHRTNPVMPSAAKTSGYCYMQYDVTDKGRTDNIETLFCTNQVFVGMSNFSVAFWRFRPRKEGGINTPERGRISLIKYELSDPCGKRIPIKF